MVHGVTFDGGRATYRNRWVRTNRLIKDAAQGFSYGEMGEMDANKLDHMPFVADEEGRRMGKANTALVYHSGRLLALEENDRPYSMDLASLSTEGLHDYGGKMEHNFSAHPKIDPVTGEMMTFGYVKKNTLTL